MVGWLRHSGIEVAPTRKRDSRRDRPTRAGHRGFRDSRKYAFDHPAWCAAALAKLWVSDRGVACRVPKGALNDCCGFDQTTLRYPEPGQSDAGIRNLREVEGHCGIM